jgi:hypothetical protein
MKTDVPPIRFAGSELREVGHVCAFFNSEDERYRVLLPFIKDGFACGDRAVHVVSPAEHHNHRHRLVDAGIDVAGAESSGQLELLSSVDAYLRDGHFDQDRMLSVFEQMVNETPKPGYVSRFVCHMEWAAEKGRSHIDDLIEFESRVNDVWSRHHDAVICVYDLAKFSGETVVDIMRTHPMIIIGGVLQENPFYLPPSQFLAELKARRTASAASSPPAP